MSGFQKRRSGIDDVIALDNSVERKNALRNYALPVFLNIKAAYDCHA